MGESAMHPVTHRLYEAVQALVRSDEWPAPGRVASEANITPQTLTNWHERGPSAQGLLEFQLAQGVSATWLLTGAGPMMMPKTRGGLRVAEPRAEYKVLWPLSDALLAAISVLDAEALRRLENGLRGQLGLEPLPRVGKSSAA